MVRIVATSDLHGNLPEIPTCDLLLIGGDICPDRTLASQAKWLDTTFRDWLKKVPAKEIVGIAGNHDLIFEEELVPEGLPWHYLNDSSIELFGFKIYGTPWQLPFWGAFNLDDAKLVKKYAVIPSQVDILISHGPPFGILDEVPIKYSMPPVKHVGSVSLLNKILEVKPKLCIFGHIHSGFGTLEKEGTLFANVCLLNNSMKVVHSPVTFEI